MPVPPELLAHVPCMQRLSLPTLDHISSVAEMPTFALGEHFYKQGDPPTGLYALLSGRVKLYRQSRDRIQILALPMKGQCFGAESLPMSAPSPCSAAALSPSRALYIHPDDVRRLSADHPDFLEMLLELVSARLKQFVSLVHDLAFRDVTARLATVLVSRALEEGKQTDHGITIDRLLSQQDFAALVGTAREVIYRTFRKLEQDRLITLTAHEICILNLEGLAELASQETR